MKKLALVDFVGVTLAGFSFSVNEFLGAIATLVVIWSTLPLGLTRWREYRTNKNK